MSKSSAEDLKPIYKAPLNLSEEEGKSLRGIVKRRIDAVNMSQGQLLEQAQASEKERIRQTAIRLGRSPSEVISDFGIFVNRAQTTNIEPKLKFRTRSKENQEHELYDSENQPKLNFIKNLVLMGYCLENGISSHNIILHESYDRNTSALKADPKVDSTLLQAAKIIVKEETKDKFFIDKAEASQQSISSVLCGYKNNLIAVMQSKVMKSKIKDAQQNNARLSNIDNSPPKPEVNNPVAVMAKNEYSQESDSSAVIYV